MKSKLPKISVITPSHNQGEFIEQTIKSVINQNYPNFEYIIIDGGSTDKTLDIIKKYKKHITYFESKPDKGQTDALIKGFKKAKGEILCWLNSDDILMPNALKKVADFFIKNPKAKVVYGDSVWINKKGKFIKKKFEIPFNKFIFLYDYNYIPQPSTFFKKTLYKEVKGLNPKFNLVMDSDLWLRFSEKTKLHHIKEVLSKMRKYPEQKNQKFRKQSNIEGLKAREKYLKNQSTLSRKMKYLLAKFWRIILKIKNHCY